MKIAFLGPRGSFSHHVAQAAFPSQDLVPYQNITEVMKAYEAREVDYSVVPVENSIEGSVHETLDYLFHQADIQAVAEIVQPIKQQLLVTDLEKPIEKIFSHPQAIAQGKKYIRQHYPQAAIEVTASTAYAARFVAEHPEKNFAAIAPRTAAAEYGLKVAASMDTQHTRLRVMNLTILDTTNGRHSSWNWSKTCFSQTPRPENLTLKNLIQGLTVDLFQHKAQEQKIHIRIAEGLIFKHRQMIECCFQLRSCQLVTIGNKGIQS